MIKITQDDLLAGEHIIFSKNANAIIRIDEHGLSKFAFGQLMWLVGMKGKEAIGGQLHLTNYRLLFKSHAINRVRGKFSIFLPTIREVRDASVFVSKKIIVTTGTQHFEFVVWGVPQVLAAISSAQSNLTSDQRAWLQTAVFSDYRKCGDGLQVWQGLENLNKGLLIVEQLISIAKIAGTPVQATTILNLIELLSS